MRRLLCAALLVFITPLQAAEPDSLAAAREAIDACTKRLDPDVDIGYERVAARCPGLERALERSGFEQWLPQGWKESRNNLSVGSLTELRAVVERELATQATTRTPRVERLNEVLAGLGNQRVESTGTWSRFKKWLRDLVERPDRDERAGWFDRLVSRVGISDAIVEVITYIALGAMVVLALLVVVNELKAAGVLGRRGRASDGDEEADVPTARPPPAFSEIERAPLGDRPRMLLELISAKLTALRRLPPANALTVHELARRADLESEQDRRRLANIALTAERERYAADSVPEDALASAFEQGRELLQSVESLRAPEPATGSAS